MEEPFSLVNINKAFTSRIYIVWHYIIILLEKVRDRYNKFRFEGSFGIIKNSWKKQSRKNIQTGRKQLIRSELRTRHTHARVSWAVS